MEMPVSLYLSSLNEQEMKFYITTDIFISDTSFH